MALTCLQA